MKNLKLFIYIFLVLLKFSIVIAQENNIEITINQNEYNISFEHYDDMQNNKEIITQKDILSFLENIKYIYLYLSPKEHKTFSLDTVYIQDGSIIENTEQVANQLAYHVYKVCIKKQSNEIIWVSSSIVKTKIFLLSITTPVKTTLYFNYTNGLKTKLILDFTNQKDFQQALDHNVIQIWGQHFIKEITNGKTILNYLKISEQLYKDPNTWDINHIKDDLIY
jgi:hypothetical protein